LICANGALLCGDKIVSIPAMRSKKGRLTALQATAARAPRSTSTPMTGKHDAVPESLLGKNEDIAALDRLPRPQHQMAQRGAALAGSKIRPAGSVDGLHIGQSLRDIRLAATETSQD
jgi:hypothetical protein